MSLQRIPGLIDVHVHLREPGATHKEDFYTGSRAALVGGFTYVLDMPNNVLPILTKERLEEKIALAKSKAICDIGFHFGTDGHNTGEFAKVVDMGEVFGLKIYCNHTTGEMLIDDVNLLDNVFSSWNSDKPILVHAEGPQLVTAITLAEKYNKKIHICHISQESEVELVRQAKKNTAKKIKITAGVCPHHLCFTSDAVSKMKGYAMMKPPLGTQKDIDALFLGLNDGTIDIVETDHAPHTKEEKEKENPPFGVPGLEQALSFLYKSVKDGKIKMEDVIKFLYINPKKIFNIPDQSDTYIEVDPDVSYVVGESEYETKCNWSPYEGMTFYGKVQTVVFRGKKLLENGKII